jgi:hypothetical protein
MKRTYPDETIELARTQYLQGIPIRTIATNLGLPRFTTICRWVKQFSWVRKNSDEAVVVIDAQTEIVGKLITQFNPLVEAIDFSALEEKQMVNIYLKLLSHQLKLVKLKAPQQVLKSESIFKFE